MELSKVKTVDFLQDPKIQGLKSYPFFQKVDKILQEDGARFRAKVKSSNLFNFQVQNDFCGPSCR
jgi:hypothetical protein